MPNTANIPFRSDDQLFNEVNNIYYADPSFFSLFDFALMEGNATTSLKGPDHVVLTAQAAMKYFGSVSVVGNTILYDEQILLITGVMKNPPENSQFQFDFLISMETFFKDKPDIRENWGWLPVNTYLLLNEGSSKDMLEKRFNQIKAYEDNKGSEEHYILSTTSFNQLHFSEARLGEHGVKGSMTNIYVLTVIGLTILLLAAFNYINLTTAQRSIENKSVAVRKTLGASFNEIFKQYFMESLILCTLASIASFLITFLLLNQFENFMNHRYDLNFIQSYWIPALVFLFVIVLSVCSGGVPAVRFSSIPAANLMHKKKSGEGIISARTGMIVFQFCITSVLIIITLIIDGQLDYLQSKDLGVNTKHKLVINYGNNHSVSNAFQTVKSELGSVPGVMGVTFSSHVPGEMPHGVTTKITSENGIERSKEINLMLVDYDFLDQYAIKLVSGKPITQSILSTSDNMLLINEATLKAYGYNDPDEVIGKSFEQWGGNGIVGGVFSDFNYLSLHHQVGLLSLKMWPIEFQKITVAISASDIAAVVSLLKKKWTALYPGIPFEYYFVDDLYFKQYETDKRFAAIIGIFTVISVSIGVIGLVSFATFWCERKKKEVAIRKIMGASNMNLMLHLYKNFGLPVLVSFILAIPLAWHFGDLWLNQFAYKNTIQGYQIIVPLFLLAGLILLSVIAQVARTVITNPVENLKEE